MLLHFYVFSQTKGEKWGEMKIFLLFSFIYYKKRVTLQKIPYGASCYAGGRVPCQWGRKQPWAG